jgi:hypothetical protein
MDKVMQEIVDIHKPLFSLTRSFKRVLWFYTLVFIPPIVAARVSERQQGYEYASLTAAVRGLADD